MATTATGLSVLGQSSGTQSTTENPQTPSASSGMTAPQQNSSVQPGTSTNLLKSTGGQSLSSPALPTINLSDFNQSGATSTQTSLPKPPANHFQTAYLAIPIVLVVLALALFWIANHSIKKTTDY